MTESKWAWFQFQCGNDKKALLDQLRSLVLLVIIELTMTCAIWLHGLLYWANSGRRDAVCERLLLSIADAQENKLIVSSILTIVIRSFAESGRTGAHDPQRSFVYFN